MDDRLIEYVRKAREAGPLGDEHLRERLLKAGWSKSEVDRALAAWVHVYTEKGNDAELVPAPLSVPSKLDAALFFMRSAAFFVGIWAVVDLLFTFVNAVVPEPGGWRGSEAYGIREAVSMLTVALPLFLVTHLKLRSDLRKDPSKLDSPVRRWLIVITMGASGIAAMTGAIMLVEGLLQFEGNLNGGIKLVLLIAVSVGVFIEYWWAYRMQDPSVPVSPARRAFERIALGAVLVLYVSGFVMALAKREPAPEPYPREPVPEKPVDPPSPALPNDAS